MVFELIFLLRDGATQEYMQGKNVNHATSAKIRLFKLNCLFML